MSLLHFWVAWRLEKIHGHDDEVVKSHDWVIDDVYQCLPNVSDPANDNNNDTQYLSLFFHTATAQFPKQ